MLLLHPGKTLGLGALLALAIAVAPLARAGEVTVFAAASLKTALDAALTEWSAAEGHDVTVSYAGSSALARQIEAGAPADLYLSANLAWMDHLEGRGLIDPATRVAPLSNRLVVIAPGREGPALAEVSALPDALGEDGRLAMALVEAVPAGIYGKAALSALGIWPAVAGRVAQTDNARAALALVATGEAELGIVYATDAGAADAVHVVATLPADSHPPIRYAMAVVPGGEAALAAELLSWLASPAGLHHFEEEGFLPLTAR